MIYITGDTHADFGRFTTRRFPKQQRMNKNDYLIICGDFGGVWCYKGESNEEAYNLNWLEEKPFTTLFVDGNHECFERLYNEYLVEEWHGGKVHKIRPSIIHLMRGQVYEIDGLKIFTFGGAKSHDISGGLLDPNEPDFEEKRKRLRRGWEPFRIIGMSWWEQELPTKKEMFEGLKNLGEHDFEVDYIITHCASSKVQNILDDYKSIYTPDILTDYFDDIRSRCKYKKWYFGHYHDIRNATDKDILLYENIIELGELASEHIPGRPRCMKGDLVKFTFDNGREKSEVEGRIAIVDPYGTLGQSEEPSYDIYVRENNDEVLYKHIRESWIHF